MSKQIDHIHLFGNSQENFYQLGVRDKIAFKEVHDKISMLCLRSSMLGKLLKRTTELSTNFIKVNHQNQNIKDLAAYAEGLNRPLEDVLFTSLLPEMVAAFNKWSPDLLSLIPGCSSLFVWDATNKGVIHTRILDYALSGTFDKYERSVLYDFPGRNKIFSYQSAGIPMGSMSAMNDKGLTVALHYKHGNYFNLNGESILFILSDILSYTQNIREALKMLRKKESISLWGLYLSDKNGEVASIDICGKDIYQEKFDIKDHKYLYFNNRTVLHKREHENLQPFGNLSQCQMRADVMAKRMSSFNFEAKNLMLESIKKMAKIDTKKSASAVDWKLSPVTSSSIQLYSMSAATNSSLFVTGEAPKFYNGNYIENSKIFSRLEVKVKTKTDTAQLMTGHKHIALYQSSLDTGNVVEAYHHIQMATQKFEGLAISYISQFYFLVTQYIYEKDTRDLIYIYEDMIKLEKKLPAYLEDHRQLFIHRLAKLLDHPETNFSARIKSQKLRNLYQHEKKLNKLAHKGLKKLIFPRIDIIDIIYAY